MESISVENKQASKQLNYTEWFNDHFKFGLKQILRFSLKNPRMARIMAGKILRFYSASHRRQQWADKGVQVPPMLIYSVTNECNLDCAGCYAKILHAPKRGEFNADKFAQVIQEADDIGVSYILVAGGEPFMRPELLDVTNQHPNIIFTPFTNGLLVNDDHTQRLKKQPHVVPIVSFEGYEFETDKRRGMGVYENGLALVERFQHAGIYYGVSITTTRGNFETITSREFISRLADLGCKVFFFINYIPVAEDTDDMVMTIPQVNELNRIMEQYRSQYQALFLAFPGSEIDFGGCLAAGKGFVHINAEGDVEPCPFSPYSDASLRDKSLIEALQSPLLSAIRKNDFRLDESNGICALWQNREWVKELTEDLAIPN
jgi:MoaA/NifB/PqqE/SkfB family radical SAM enzyme